VTRLTTRGKHRSKTAAELRCDVQRLEAALAECERQLDQAGIELSGMRIDLEAARAEIEQLQATADQPRQRFVVPVTAQPVRTWPAALGPAVRDTSNETTQELPIPGRTQRA
jgi:septal ring factor EnvC (AmiA/AmiB activator)